MDLKQVLENVIITSEENIGRDESDYEKDGILFCGKCDTAKQVKIEIFGMSRTPFCLCKCAAERLAQEEAELKQRQRMQEIEKLRRDGFPDRDMRNWTFENDDGNNPRIMSIANKYVDNFAQMKEDGKGLLLFGSVGTGKTYAAACIANALINKGRPCLVTNFARLVNTLSGMYEGKQDYIDELINFDLVVIDDLGSERDTPYMYEIIQNIVDSRYRAKLPTIVTTNLTSEELKHPAEMKQQRIYSRLFEMCLPVEVEGKDRRKEKLKNEFAAYDELLGLKSDKIN